MTDYANADALVATGRLATNLNNSSLRVLIAGPERPDMPALPDDVLDAVSRGGTSFVGVGSPEGYCGVTSAPDHLPQERPYVVGRIPGAVTIHWSKAANDEGSFRSGDELTKLHLEVPDISPLITYCRIGERVIALHGSCSMSSRPLTGRHIRRFLD